MGFPQLLAVVAVSLLVAWRLQGYFGRGHVDKMMEHEMMEHEMMEAVLGEGMILDGEMEEGDMMEREMMEEMEGAASAAEIDAERAEDSVLAVPLGPPPVVPFWVSMPRWMQMTISVPLLGAALYIILVGDSIDADAKWAFGVIGAVAGFWSKD